MPPPHLVERLAHRTQDPAAWGTLPILLGSARNGFSWTGPSEFACPQASSQACAGLQPPQGQMLPGPPPGRAADPQNCSDGSPFSSTTKAFASKLSLKSCWFLGWDESLVLSEAPKRLGNQLSLSPPPAFPPSANDMKLKGILPPQKHQQRLLNLISSRGC